MECIASKEDQERAIIRHEVVVKLIVAYGAGTVTKKRLEEAFMRAAIDRPWCFANGDLLDAGLLAPDDERNGRWVVVRGNDLVPSYRNAAGFDVSHLHALQVWLNKIGCAVRVNLNVPYVIASVTAETSAVLGPGHAS